MSLTYTANAASSAYGSAITPVSGAVSATGLANGDTLASLGTASWTTSAASGSNAGKYGITGSGLADANYTITATQAAGNTTAYTINPAALSLTYTANAASVLFGQALPALSGTAGASGFANGDTMQSTFSGTAVWTTTATAASPAGNYAIDGSGLVVSPNYTLTIVQSPANATALTIQPSGQSQTAFVPAASSTGPSVQAEGPHTAPSEYCTSGAVANAYRASGQVVISGAGSMCSGR